MSNQPISEQYGKIAEEWVDAEAAASLLEETRSATFSQWVMKQGDIAVNRAEHIVKASPEWMEYNRKMVNARKLANLKKVQMEQIKMRHWEAQSESANARVEARL